MQTLAKHAPGDAQARRWKEDYARELLRIAQDQVRELVDGLRRDGLTEDEIFRLCEAELLHAGARGQKGRRA